MDYPRKWQPHSIRINPQAIKKARIAALQDDKTLGDWLEEAINEKIERENGNGDVTEKTG